MTLFETMMFFVTRRCFLKKVYRKLKSKIYNLPVYHNVSCFSEKFKTVHFSFSTPWRRIGTYEVRLQSFLITTLDVGGWVSSRSGRFN